MQPATARQVKAINITAKSLQTARVDHIPLVYVLPEPTPQAQAQPQAPVAVIWLPGFSGSKEGTAAQLHALADAGYLALSFDPWQHGERLMESREELGQRILSNIRRHFWPILARTAEEVPRVLDFAQQQLGAALQSGVGGDSMGGDIALAAAGLEPRLRAVAVRIATPDWLRPNSFEPPGLPDSYAIRCYSALDPITHLHHYSHGPHLSLQCGDEDQQVPAEAAVRFLAQLNALYPQVGAGCEVVLHPETGHASTTAMWQNCVAWFQRHLPPNAGQTAKEGL